ncbi:MAG: aminoacyl-tRNA hydrolase [Spirochaetia bacterium]|jgi:PTH1 family peptidyl-tRNA hydrolase|nr:aminoacyl-tRNA hydrolase [Spirochaetia bacterium]
MKIIAFLGNPGRQYARNRHNAGFIAGEYFCDKHSIKPGQKKFSSFVGTGTVNDTELCLLFPQTFMNNSGEAVAKALNFYKEKAANIIAVHDEIELPFGKLALKFGGGHKGHNGLRSIIDHVDTADFARLRFGVGRPDNPEIDVADYVLGNFFSEEMSRIIELLPETAAILEKEIAAER